jgi:transcriptional regulator with XRE-family HTH domain
MSDELRAWLAQELERRKWSQRELARQADISRAFVNRVLSGDISPSVNFCYKIAQALGEAPEKVLRLAGILPSNQTEDNTLQELIELARNLPPEDRTELLKYARFRYQQRKG